LAKVEQVWPCGNTCTASTRSFDASQNPIIDIVDIQDVLTTSSLIQVFAKLAVQLRGIVTRKQVIYRVWTSTGQYERFVFLETDGEEDTVLLLREGIVVSILRYC
jgi:hypothetical protein